jgi:RNA polymerase sigma factor (sigma-70 family)
LSSITPEEMKVAERVGKRAASRWKNVQAEDVISELYLWLALNREPIDRWKNEEGGDGKLFVTLRREAAKYCAKEEATIIGRPLRQDNFYTVSLLKRALPFVFESVPETIAKVNPVTGESYSTGSPEDFGNAQAIMADIRGALYGINREMRTIIELRYRDGLTLEEIGELNNVTKVAAMNRVDRAVQRLSDALSGERI